MPYTIRHFASQEALVFNHRIHGVRRIMKMYVLVVCHYLVSFIRVRIGGQRFSLTWAWHIRLFGFREQDHVHVTPLLMLTHLLEAFGAASQLISLGGANSTCTWWWLLDLALLL